MFPLSVQILDVVCDPYRRAPRAFVVGERYVMGCQCASEVYRSAHAGHPPDRRGVRVRGVDFDPDGEAAGASVEICCHRAECLGEHDVGTTVHKHRRLSVALDRHPGHRTFDGELEKFDLHFFGERAYSASAQNRWGVNRVGHGVLSDTRCSRVSLVVRGVQIGGFGCVSWWYPGVRVSGLVVPGCPSGHTLKHLSERVSDAACSLRGCRTPKSLPSSSLTVTRSRLEPSTPSRSLTSQRATASTPMRSMVFSPCCCCCCRTRNPPMWRSRLTCHELPFAPSSTPSTKAPAVKPLNLSRGRCRCCRRRCRRWESPFL